MSHAVQINYEQIAVQCHSICEVAENQVAELDKMLADLEGSSSRLLNDQTEALRKQIEREKNQLLKEIQAVLARADEDDHTAGFDCMLGVIQRLLGLIQIGILGCAALAAGLSAPAAFFPPFLSTRKEMGSRVHERHRALQKESLSAQAAGGG